MDSPPRRAPAFSIDEFGQLVSSALESQEHFKPTLDFAFMEPRYLESRFSLDTLDSDPTDVFASSNTRPEAPRKLFRSLRALVTGKRATEQPYRSPVVVSRDVDPFTQSAHSSAFVPYGVPYHDGLEDYPPPSPTLFARSCASPDSFEELDRRASVHSDSSACATSSLSTAGSSSACTDRSAPPLSPLFFAPSDPDATRRAYSDLGHGAKERAEEFDADPFAKDTVQIMPRTPPRRVARHPRSEPPAARSLPRRTPPPMVSPPACPLPGMPHGGCGDWTLSLPLPAPAPLEEVHARADVNAALNRDLSCSRWFPSPPPSPSPPTRRRGALRPSTSSGALETSTPSRLRGSSSALSLPPPIMRRPSRASSTTSSKKRVAFAVEVITPVQELKAPIWEPSTPPESIQADPVDDDDDDNVPLQQLVQALEGVAVRRSAEIASMLDVGQKTAAMPPSVARLTDEDSTRRPDSPFPLLQPKRSKPEVSSSSSSTPTPPSSGSKLTRSKPVSPRQPIRPSRIPSSPSRTTTSPHSRTPTSPRSRTPTSPRTPKSPRTPTSPRSVAFPARSISPPSPRPGRSPYGRPSSRLAIRPPAPRRSSPAPPMPKVVIPPMPPMPRTPPRTRLAGRRPTTPGSPSTGPGTPASMSSASFHTARSSFDTEAL